MERWKTISRQDPAFLAHLDGSFSASHRALPQRSLNVGTLGEVVTFEIVPLEEIQRPSLVKVFWQAIRPQSLVLSAAPMLASWLYCVARGLETRTWIAASSFFGVLLFHVAANLFNDYGDHLRGRDRVRQRGGSRVLQRGWIAAALLRRVAWAAMLAAGFLGLPAIVFSTTPVVLVAVLVALAGIEFAFQKLRLQHRGWSEIVAFALTGPALVAGFAWAITGRAGLEDLALGCIYGSFTMMYFHSVNFENIMTDSQAGVRTWATRAGFEASKRFFYFTAGLAFVCMLAFAVVFAYDVRLLPPVLALGALLFAVVRRVRSVASPLSSQLADLRGSVVWVSWSTTLVLLGSFVAMLARR